MKYLNLTVNKSVIILTIGDRSEGEASTRARENAKKQTQKSSEQGKGERAQMRARLHTFSRSSVNRACQGVGRRRSRAYMCLRVYMHALLRSARATEQPSDRRYERSTKPQRDQASKRSSDQVSKQERDRPRCAMYVCACV